MTTAERTARLWLRAYPRRWRYAYGEDLVGTLLDLAGPDARTVRVRDGVSVVRAGWSLRWREHPPLLPWLGYRMFEMRLPARYRYWVMDDLLDRFYTARMAAVGFVTVAALFAVLSAAIPSLRSVLIPDSWDLPIMFGLTVVLLAVLQPRVAPRRVWRRQISTWLPSELRPRAERWKADVELAQYRAALRADGEAGPAGGGAHV